jgi:hypothetical protein
VSSLLAERYGLRWSELLAWHWLSAVLGLSALVAHELSRRRRVRGREPHPLLRSLLRPWVVLLAIAVAELIPQIGLVAELTVLRRESAELQERKAHDYVHYATNHDYGTPPRPRRLPGPKKIRATYYRGNDERDPRLFNGGHYLTATFQVSIDLADGASATSRPAIAGRLAGLRIEISRGPNTPDFFWTRDRMAVVYLTRQSDPFMGARAPVADRVGLTELQPMQHWAATYPLEVPATGAARLQGIVYLCEEIRHEARLLGGRFHYAVEYDLSFQDGKLLAGSDLWMGSVYRGRAFAAEQISDDQWFSDCPIPGKPAPGMQDTGLLGIDEYKAPGAL